MKRIRTAFQITVLVAAGLGLSGGHWAILQSIVWTGMFLDYSAEAGWIEAARKTFSVPCSMCRQIATARQQEQEHSQPAGTAQELRGLPGPVRLTLIAPDLRLLAEQPPPLFPAISRAHKPPSPIPIAA